MTNHAFQGESFLAGRIKLKSLPKLLLYSVTDSQIYLMIHNFSEIRSVIPCASSFLSMGLFDEIEALFGLKP